MTNTINYETFLKSRDYTTPGYFIVLEEAISKFNLNYDETFALIESCCKMGKFIIYDLEINQYGIFNESIKKVRKSKKLKTFKKLEEIFTEYYEHVKRCAFSN